MEFFTENHDNILYALGGLSLVIELSVMGLSGPLLFFALGCIITGFLVSFGVLSGWEIEALSVGVTSLLCALILWKPLKKFQGEGKAEDTSSDMIGQTVPVSEDVTSKGGSIRHSGINWQARLHPEAGVDQIDAGEQAVICAVEGTVMLIKHV